MTLADKSLGNLECNIGVFGSGDRDVNTAKNWCGAVVRKSIEQWIVDWEDTSAMGWVLWSPSPPVDNA